MVSRSRAWILAKRGINAKVVVLCIHGFLRGLGRDRSTYPLFVLWSGISLFRFFLSASTHHTKSMRYFSPRATFARTAIVRAVLLRATFARAMNSLVPRRTRAQRKRSTRISLTFALVKTLGADTAMLLAGWLVSVLSVQAMETLTVPYHKVAVLLPPGWFVVVGCLLLPSVWLAVDLSKALSYPQALPFAGLRSTLEKCYRQRFYLLLLAFCFVAKLTLLCMVATKMLIAAKLVLSAAFVVALHVLNRKRFSHRSILFVPSTLLLGLLFVNQSIVIVRLAASFVQSFI